MVIDTSRLGTPKMFITKQVAHLEIADGMWHITFETSPISYTYRYERIKFFTKVEKIFGNCIVSVTPAIITMRYLVTEQNWITTRKTYTSPARHSTNAEATLGNTSTNWLRKPDSKWKASVIS